MLPIIDKPLLQYAVEEAIEIGVEEIIFITSNEKHSIEKHFQENIDMANRLIKSGKEDYLEKLNPKVFSDIKFHYINQNNQNGLGDAVLHAKEIVGDDSFAVLLPDDLFISNISCLRQLIDTYKKTNSSVIAVNKIDKENIHKYGVINPGIKEHDAILIEDIIEKPKAKEAPSDIAVCGRYIFTSLIFDHLEATNFDKSGEIQLTDAIKSLINNQKVHARLYDGEKFDCGSKKGFVHATIALALRDNSISKDISKIIKEII
jgi:UTP--glucose-1-phosphate uridylyltransferase